MVTSFTATIFAMVCFWFGEVYAKPGSIGGSRMMNALRPGQTIRGKNVSMILKSYDPEDKGDYDKRVRPNYGGPPVEVGVTMQIISISSVSEVQMDFTCDFYFRQTWRDERLSFTKTKDLEKLTVGAKVADLIWVPDTFFANEKSSYFHEATTFNTFLRISAEGEVYRSIRLTATSSCPMNLRYFPMDRQKCTIEIESFGYTTRDIRYRWANGLRSIEISDEVELPQFRVTNYSHHHKDVHFSTGNYSRLVCRIKFSRSMGYYLIQIYIPASLIVVISWVSFWLHRNASPARVALGVMTVLTMTTLMSNTNAALPKISYIKSIDIYLGTCFVMVFTSLLEYAAVGYLGKRIAMKKARLQQLAKLAEQHRQQKFQAPSSGPPPTLPRHSSIAAQGDHTELHSPELPFVKTLGSCQVCPVALTSQGQRDAQHGFTMTFYNDRQVRCPGLPGSCGVCPTATIQHGIHPQEVRLRMVDTKPQPPLMTKGGTPPTPDPHPAEPPSAPDIAHPPGSKNPNKIFGVSAADIDKYSRVVFPVFFVCFNLMYWIIYLHISAENDFDDES